MLFLKILIEIVRTTDAVWYFWTWTWQNNQ